MTDWPSLPGDDKELIYLVPRLYPARAEERTKRGRLIQPGHPAYADVIFSLPLPLRTANPDRLRANAQILLDAADDLEGYHAARLEDDCEVSG